MRDGRIVFQTTPRWVASNLPLVWGENTICAVGVPPLPSVPIAEIVSICEVTLIETKMDGATSPPIQPVTLALFGCRSFAIVNQCLESMTISFSLKRTGQHRRRAGLPAGLACSILGGCNDFARYSSLAGFAALLGLL